MSTPVSAALEAVLRKTVRRSGIVLWLDADSTYTGFVDQLIDRNLPYKVCAFRGSYLELLLKLESVAGGTGPSSLVVHLPGFNEDTVKTTPLLELYAAGTRFRKAIGTLINETAAGHARPDQISAFLSSDEVTLESADVWLSDIKSAVSGDFEGKLKLLSLNKVVKKLLDRKMSGHVSNEADCKALWNRLTAWTGLSSAWREQTQVSEIINSEDMAFVVASWALCVEYTDDLNRKPIEPLLKPITQLSRSVVKTCKELAEYLRSNESGFYRRTADETEAFLTKEIEEARAEDLGKIDTFRFEEAKILTDALEALAGERWDTALEWAKLRIEGDSFWLRGDPSHRSAWLLLVDAARLGKAIEQAGTKLNAPSGLEEAVERYVEAGAVVDQAHRHLEQHRLALLLTELPHFETFRVRLDAMRTVWQKWADAWATAFNKLCLKHSFLPPSSHQQRTLFDDVVRPMALEKGTTALFTIDAFRYEMADELFQALKDSPATTIHLKARLAELPTVTSVGMNVLAPVVSGGKLKPIVKKGIIESFTTGEFRVKDPDTRKRAMQHRVGGSTCPRLSLDEVVGRDAKSLKRSVSKANLVVVHSREIDHASESGVGLPVFDHVMQKLRAAWRLLRDAGIRRFIFTADHGFLLLHNPELITHGSNNDSKRRYALSSVGEEHRQKVQVPLKDLSYEEVDGHLIFPKTTAIFETGQPFNGFVHGGNSLQERVIPVLTLVHRAAAGGNTQKYRLGAWPLDGVAGMHCIEAQVDIVANQELNFGGTSDVELALRVIDVSDVMVELCHVRGSGKLSAGTVTASVGEKFELFFRLSGNTDTKVRVELHHPSATENVEPRTIDSRFTVSASRVSQKVKIEESKEKKKKPHMENWLEQLPVEVRAVFSHIEEHGTLNESEATGMLGNARKFRKFSRHFEQYTSKAPFNVRIEVLAGVKQFIREGF